MDKLAIDLVQQYVNGWKENDLQKILSCLTEDCVVIESHGPSYDGAEDIKKWFQLWLEADSKITKWDILSFHYLEHEKSAFFEWDFACVSNSKKYAFPGMSIVRFVADKINFIHEYRMTKPRYQWQRNELKSE